MSVLNLVLIQGVTTVQGTAGQILANGLLTPQTNAVVLSLDGSSTGITGALYTIITGISGYDAAVYATKVSLASTGQQAWTAGQNNALNLSGTIAATGQQAWTAANNNAINLSGRLIAASGGQIVYTTGTQSITGLKTFNSGLFVGRVGIGTTVPTPATQLHVAGGITGGAVSGNTLGVASDAYIMGNLGIGTTTPAYKLEVSGSFGATTKSFDIPHPTRPGYRLVYGVTESDHHGVFLRGKLNGSGIVQFPEYWSGLVHEGSVTVGITPVGGAQRLYLVGEPTVGGFTVGSHDGDSSTISCHWRAEATRKDVPAIIVEKREEAL